VEDDGLHVPVTALGPVTVRLVGQLAVSPVDVETVVVRVTVAVKPLTGLSVIVELPVAPVLKSAGEVALIVKSTTPLKVNVAVVGCEVVPGVPTALMSTMKLPAVGEVHERLEVPVPFAVSDTGVTVNGLQVKPVGTVSPRATEPTKF
jgi:hypothetical protein